MDPGPVGRRLTEKGVSSVQFLLASVLALTLFLVFANLVVVQYGRGAVRSALEQGARVGAVTRSAADCEAKAADVVGQLLGGRMSDGLVIHCDIDGLVVIASARAVFRAWVGLVPDFEVAISTEAILEPER